MKNTSKWYDGVERRNDRRIRDDADIARRWRVLRAQQAMLEEWRRRNYEPRSPAGVVEEVN